MSDSIKESYQEILTRIERACVKCGRNPDEITLVAVSKTKPDSDVLELLDLGQLHFGENRAKSLEERLKSIQDETIQWHFIGNLQTNKIKYMAPRVNWIQSVHKIKALKEIEKRAAEEKRVINALVQVNISEEDQKSGCDPEALESILKYGQSLTFTKVRGLMGMATFTDNAEKVRAEFQSLKSLFDQHTHLATGNVTLEHLSMGMTNDLEVAIEEGSTMLRIGTAIFGERNYG
jgi:pyridoxal phosphate enzyme (YggS family)